MGVSTFTEKTVKVETPYRAANPNMDLRMGVTILDTPLWAFRGGIFRCQNFITIY